MFVLKIYRRDFILTWFFVRMSEGYNIMDYKDCLQQIQKYLENSPLIVLGSGSSADYGIPLMDELSDEIKKHNVKFDPMEFESLCKNLASMNLEKALDETNLSETSLNTLRKIVWEYINERDLLFLKKLSQDKSGFSLADLLKIFIQPTPNTVTVVTTNYDRLTEYASDLIGATTVTGFEGNIIRKIDFPKAVLQQKRVRARERVVNVWKVHGSLDWFLKNNGDIVSYPITMEIPSNYNPLIIAPGKEKYNLMYSEPYRDIIAQADSAFSKAGSFLCIGYGFNDDHIQPKLIEQIKKEKPIVSLCRIASDACKQNIMTANVKKFAIIEYSSDGKTLVSGNGYSEIYDGNFWKLPDFVKIIWGEKNGYL